MVDRFCVCLCLGGGGGEGRMEDLDRLAAQDAVVENSSLHCCTLEGEEFPPLFWVGGWGVPAAAMRLPTGTPVPTIYGVSLGATLAPANLLTTYGGGTTGLPGMPLLCQTVA